jgi:hypothetical protein
MATFGLEKKGSPINDAFNKGKMHTQKTRERCTEHRHRLIIRSWIFIPRKVRINSEQCLQQRDEFISAIARVPLVKVRPTVFTLITKTWCRKNIMDNEVLLVLPPPLAEPTT